MVGRAGWIGTRDHSTLANIPYTDSMGYWIHWFSPRFFGYKSDPKYMSMHAACPVPLGDFSKCLVFCSFGEDKYFDDDT